MTFNELYTLMLSNRQLFVQIYKFLNNQEYDENIVNEQIGYQILQLQGSMTIDQIIDKLNPNMVYAINKKQNNNVLDIILGQINLGNSLFDNLIQDDNFWYLLSEYAKKNNKFKKKINWTNTPQLLNQNNLTNDVQRFDYADITIENFFSDNIKKNGTSIECLKDKKNKNIPDKNLLTITYNTVKSYAIVPTSHIERAQRLRIFFNSKFTAATDFYLYVPICLTYNDNGLWQTDNYYDFKIVDNNGIAYPIRLKNDTLTFYPQTILLLTSKNQFTQDHVKVKSINIIETHQIYKKPNGQNRQLKVNDKIIKLEYDNSPSHIIFHDKLDAMGMAKFKDEFYLFDQNYNVYEQIGKDLTGKTTLTETQIFEIIFDLYQDLNITQLEKRYNRNILKIKQEFDQLKQKKGLKQQNYGVELSPRNDQELRKYKDKFIALNSFDIDKNQFIIAKKQFDKFIQKYY